MPVMLYNDLSYCLNTIIGMGQHSGSLVKSGNSFEYKISTLGWCESSVLFRCLKGGSLVVKWSARSLLDDVPFAEDFSVKYVKCPDNLYPLVSESLGMCERMLILSRTYVGSVLTSKRVYDSSVRQAAVTYRSGVEYAHDEALRGLTALKARVSP